MEIEVKIRALMMDPNSGTPIIILKDVQSDTMLPIWVGAYEANAIALEIEKIAPPPVISKLVEPPAVPPKVGVSVKSSESPPDRTEPSKPRTTALVPLTVTVPSTPLSLSSAACEANADVAFSSTDTETKASEP